MSLSKTKQKQLNGTKKKKFKIRKNDLQLFSMAAPGLALILTFCYLPMFGIVLAFKKFKYNLGIFGSPWCGLDNLEFFINSGTLGRLLKNTVGLNLVFLICNTIATVVLALLLYEVVNRVAIKTFQTIMFLPFVISWAAASYALYANLSDVNGIVNGILTSMGQEKTVWYAEPEKWPVILLICYLWKSVGFGMVVYYGNLISVDKSYFEAAQLDGATRLQTMRYISFPFIRPIVTMFFILGLGKIFNSDFGLFYYLTKDSSLLYPATDVIDTYVYRALRVTGNVGMSSAVGLCQSVIGFFVLLLTNRLASRFSDGGAMFW